MSNDIDADIKVYKNQIAKAEALVRLENNEDFKAVFIEGLLSKWRMVDLLSKRVSPGFQDPANSTYIEGQLQTIGGFDSFMLTIRQNGREALDRLKDAEEEKLNILNGED